MNVSKYIKRERAPKPTIHENDYIEEFKNPHHFSVAGASRPLDNEISGGKQFAIHKSEKLPLDDFAFDAHQSIKAGEHPWDVYGGSFGSPLDLPIESNLLFNPNNLNDKEVFVARWQQEEGTANDFTQRLENFKTNKPLTEIRCEESDYQSSLRLLKSQLDNDILPSEGLKKQYKTDKVKATEYNAKVTKGFENLKKVVNKRRPKIVVEPAIVTTPPPSSGTDTASGAPLSTAAAVTPPPPKAATKTHKRTGSGDSETMSDINSDLTSAAAESYTGTAGEINLLVDIGDWFSRSNKLDRPELVQIISKMKKAGIYLPPNTSTQKGLMTKYKEYIKKHHVKDSKLESFADL